MSIKYFYLGLEASVRSNNRYPTLEEALEVASFASKRLSIPIRIFAMYENNHSAVVQAVKPEDAAKFNIPRIYSI